jgi:hypothetical protein
LSAQLLSGGMISGLPGLVYWTRVQPKGAFACRMISGLSGLVYCYFTPQP